MSFAFIIGGRVQNVFDARVEFLKSQSAIRVEFAKKKKIFPPGKLYNMFSSTVEVNIVSPYKK